MSLDVSDEFLITEIALLVDDVEVVVFRTALTGLRSHVEELR